MQEADRLRYDGEYDAAITIYDALVAEFADDAEAYLVYHGRGLAYCFNGFFDESIADLEKMRGQRPDFVKGRVELFKTYLMLGMNDEALAEMKQVWKLEPGNEEVAKAAIYFPDFDPES
ncbi:MAG: hypothetical protein IT204_08080 [Fimbriimonadaceae bacterium]|nr:hypothetical protein [Fimbriimonadaceae bacterium]